LSRFRWCASTYVILSQLYNAHVVIGRLIKYSRRSVTVVVLCNAYVMGKFSGRISMCTEKRPYMYRALGNKYESGCFAITVSEIRETGRADNLLLVKQNKHPADPSMVRNEIYKLLLRAANVFDTYLPTYIHHHHWFHGKSSTPGSRLTIYRDATLSTRRSSCVHWNPLNLLLSQQLLKIKCVRIIFQLFYKNELNIYILITNTH